MSLVPNQTFANPTTPYFEPAGETLRASTTNQPTNFTELFAYAPDVTGVLCNSFAGGNASSQLQLQSDASTGFASILAGTTPTIATAMNIGVNVSNNGVAHGRVIFTLPPQLASAGTPLALPFVLNQAWAGGVNTTYSITMTPPAGIFTRPNILVKSQYTSRNNDAANQVNVIPSVQVPSFPSQAGTQLVVGNSGQDSFSQTTDFVLVQGTHYTSASTQIVFSFLIGGTAGSGVCSLTAVGLC
jgi:hypothetical protein